MGFKDIKQGGNVYVLDKSEMMVDTARVSATSLPRIDIASGVNQMVMDITIDRGGRQSTYVVPDTASTAYANNLVISLDKASVIAEVNSIKADKERLLSEAQGAKDIISKCSALLADLDDDYKRRKADEDRLNSIESSIAELKNLLIKKTTL